MAATGGPPRGVGVIRLRRIVSGGQTGVDEAALRAARSAGLEVGGWCPPAPAAEQRRIADEFGLQQTPAERSEWNARDSDATLILRPAELRAPDPGTDWTAACAARDGRPVRTLDPHAAGCARAIAAWLSSAPIGVLNVAGPAEATAPGIGAAARAVLDEAFARLAAGEPAADAGRYPAIGDYAAIGDGRCAALISREGSMDWLCWPHFSGPSVFAALLDRRCGGSFVVSPTSAARVTRRYVGETNILETSFTTSGGTAVVTDA